MQQPDPPRTRPILVLGFGAFLDVADNPSAHLAQAVDGLVMGGVPVVGGTMPVTWTGAAELTVRRAQELDARMVLGIGVAANRTAAMVERVGRRAAIGDVPDVQGEFRSAVAERGPEVYVSALADAWGAALEAPLSDDAGRYVCNAWLWQVLHAGLPAAFLHVPLAGIPVARLHEALRRMACLPVA